ncbi:MAG: InlB B-repeat-containing protein [Clostridia bacterium]|nr:InlB B-repeat-containing protein [Clostridia bacterium]
MSGYKDKSVLGWSYKPFSPTDVFITGTAGYVGGARTKSNYKTLFEDNYKTMVDDEGVSLVKNGRTLNLYPVYDWDYYTLKYDANGGVNAPESQSKVDIDSRALSISSIEPEKPNAIFVGWTTNPDGTGTVYRYGTANDTISIASNTVLYAKWQDSKTVTVSAGTGGKVSLNGGTAAASVTVSVPSGTTYTVSSNTVTFSNSDVVTATPDTGYRQVSILPASGTITDNSTVIAATFERIPCSVTVTAGSGGSITANGSITVPYGTTYAISGNNLVFTKPDATTVTVTTSANYGYAFSAFSSSSGTVTSDRTINASFSKVTYTITYNYVYDAGQGETTWTTSTSVLDIDNFTGSGNTYTIPALAPATLPTGYHMVTSNIWHLGSSSGSLVTTLDADDYAHEDHTYSLFTTLAPNTYTITLNGDGVVTPTNSPYESATATYNSSSIGSPTMPVNAAYTFQGYYDENDVKVINADGTLAASASGSGTTYTDAYSKWIYDGNVTLTAKWTANTVTVTFDYNGATGGNSTADITVTIGSTYGELPAPTKTGYTFDGWYDAETDGNGSGNRITSSSTVTAGVTTLYAKWTADTYTITYYDGGASDEIAFSGTPGEGHPASYTYGTGATLVDPSRSGYTFGGWYTNYSCTGDAVTTIGTDETGNKTFYAKWTEITYTFVLYDTDGNNVTYGGQHEITVAGSTDPYDENDDFFIGAGEKTGYNFSGGIWGCDEGYSVDVSLFNESTVRELYNSISRELVDSELAPLENNIIPLYGQFTAKTRTITYNGNNNTGGSTLSTTLTYGEPATIASNGYSRTGYDFVNWTMNADGTGTAYTEGQSLTAEAVNALVLASDSALLLHAQWTAQTYSITYKDEGNVAYSGTNEGSLPATHTYGTATDLADGVKSGYTFGGWYIAADCSGAAITTLAADGYTDDITLYAKWTANGFNVTFVKNDKEGISPVTSVWPDNQPTVTTVTLPASDPIRPGYTFSGWKDGEGNTVTNGQTLTADLTVNATWTRNKIYGVYLTNTGYTIYGVKSITPTTDDSDKQINDISIGYSTKPFYRFVFTKGAALFSDEYIGIGTARSFEFEIVFNSDAANLSSYTDDFIDDHIRVGDSLLNGSEPTAALGTYSVQIAAHDSVEAKAYYYKDATDNWVDIFEDQSASTFTQITNHISESGSGDKVTARFTATVTKKTPIQKLVTNVGIVMAPSAYLEAAPRNANTTEAKKTILSNMTPNGKAKDGYNLASPSQFSTPLEGEGFYDTNHAVPRRRYISNYVGTTFTYNARLYNAPTGRDLCAVPYVVYHVADTYRIVYGDMVIHTT